MTRLRTLSREFLAVGVELTSAQAEAHVADTQRMRSPLPVLREITREVAVEAFDPLDIVTTSKWRRPRVGVSWLSLVAWLVVGGASAWLGLQIFVSR